MHLMRTVHGGIVRRRGLVHSPESLKHLTYANPCCLVTPMGTFNYVQANCKPGDASTMWTALKCIEPHHRPSRVRCLTMGASVANDDPNGTKLPSAKPQ